MLIKECSLPSGGGSFLLETAAEKAFMPILLNPDTIDVATGYPNPKEGMMLSVDDDLY